MPVSALTKRGQTCPVDFGAKTCFTNDASCDHIIYAVVHHLNEQWRDALSAAKVHRTLDATPLQYCSERSQFDLGELAS